MAYRNRKAYNKTARRGIPKAQWGWLDSAKNWAGDKWQDFKDSSVNMSNVFGSDPQVRKDRRTAELHDPRAQYHNVKRAIGEGAPGSTVDQGVVDFVKEQGPSNPYYAMLEQHASETNPGLEQQFAGPMAPGQTGFDAFGHETGNINMDMSQDEALLAGNPNTKQPPYLKKGGILKRGGAMKSSNALGKGGTPKAKRGGSVGRNGIL